MGFSTCAFGLVSKECRRFTLLQRGWLFCAVSFGVIFMESVTTVRLFRNTCQARCLGPESYVRCQSAVLRALCAALAAVDSLWP